MPVGVKLYPRVVIVTRDRWWFMCVVENESREAGFRANPHHYVKPLDDQWLAWRRAHYAVLDIRRRVGPIYRVAAVEVKG